MGKLAHDNEALGSADTVNDAVVLQQFMLLSGEVCLTCDVDFVVEPGGLPGYQVQAETVCYRLFRRDESDSSHKVQQRG